MERTFFSGILENICLLLALCFFYGLVTPRWQITTLKGKVIAGLLFGAVAAVGMLFSVKYMSGLIFDGRTILLSVIGLFGGPVSALVVVLMTAAIRVLQGGVGLWMGLGTIASSAGIGVIYHYFRVRKYWAIRPVDLLVFGIAVHLAMLCCTALLPGNIRWQVLSNIAVPVLVVYPIATLIYGMLMLDMEKRTKAGIALQESEATLKAMFDNSFMFISLLTPDGRVVRANRMVLDFGGCDEAMIIGKPFWEIPLWSEKEEEQETVKRAVLEAVGGVSTRQEIVCVSRKYGHGYTHDLVVKTVKNDKGQVVFLIAEGWDISERKTMENALQKKTQKIQQIAYSDGLTGLPNRAHLNRFLRGQVKKSQCGEAAGTVLFIDLDDLKMINDTFGHTAGDGVIVTTSKHIVDNAEKDAFVARISGDEFIVVMPGINDRNQIAGIANKMIDALSNDHNIGGARINMSASAGVAVYPEDGDTVDEILKNADNALYAAKRSGKNCWRFYEPAMQAEAYQTMILINGLRYAAERGELSLHYQPLVNIMTRQVVGFEALLRWNSSEYGSISPARFIPLAEQCGLIQPIGKWVLREACQFTRRLADLGCADCHVSVNISPHQLASADFIDSVCTIMDEANIKPHQIEFEITENVLLISLEDAVEKLTKLHSMGIRLALDDFGTGFSSLTYLQRLPVDILKIDKTFIDMISVDEAKTAIIGSIVDMAHILGMAVTAEGVEEERQLEYLAVNYCDYAQGYLFSRPVPEEEALRMMAKS